MLDVARVLTKNGNDRFDTVVFFDRTAENVEATQKRIPGSIGFPGYFTKVVLSGQGHADVVNGDDPLEAPEEEQNTLEVQARQNLESQRVSFIRQFPFDVINLDLEEFAFKPNDPLPGDVIRTMREIVEWQKRPLKRRVGSKQYEERLSSFIMMFTTQVGPPNITEDYRQMLRECLESNVASRPELLERFRARYNHRDVNQLENADFAEFFKLGVRKILTNVLVDSDWFVDPEDGIKTYEFQRESSSGPYTMLHFVMRVCRQEPDASRRAPNTRPATVTSAYNAVVEKLFGDPPEIVTQEIAALAKLRPSLDQIFARRELYLNGKTAR